MHVVYGLALIVLGGHLDTKMFRSWGPFLNVFIFHLRTSHYLLRLSKWAITFHEVVVVQEVNWVPLG